MQPGSFPERENIYRVEFFCLDFYALRVERVREKYLLCLFLFILFINRRSVGLTVWV